MNDNNSPNMGFDIGFMKEQYDIVGDLITRAFAKDVDDDTFQELILLAKKNLKMGMHANDRILARLNEAMK